MGALGSNRKRGDECYYSLNGPSTSAFGYYSNCDYSDSPLSKKRRLSSAVEGQDKVNSLPGTSSFSLVSCSSSGSGSGVGSGALARLKMYPEPTQKLRREVHAPCRTTKFGRVSAGSSGGFRSVWSGIKEKATHMGNIFSLKLQEAKKHAFSAFRDVGVDKVDDVEPQRDKDIVDSEDSSDVEIIEDGNEVRSMITDDHRVQELDGLTPETRKEDGVLWENEYVVVPSSGGYGSTTSERNRMQMGYPGSRGLKQLVDGPAHKNMMTSVERRYSRISLLEYEITAAHSRLDVLRWERSVKKLYEKPVEEKKAEEDSLRDAFLPLTDEEEKEVDRAFSNASRRKKLVTHEDSNIDITGEVLQCLRPGQWLNDEVINMYLELLKERERREPKRFLNCHFFNTFFYKKLIGGRNGYDYKSVRRWTTHKKLGYSLIDCDKIFVPIHKEVHWCLAVINKKDQKFQYLDSLGGRDSQVMKVLARYIMDEAKDKSGVDMDVTSWECEYVDDLPEQHNGFDCGVFMIKYTDFYSRGMGLHFSQDNMPYFRRRTAKEILRLRAN